MLRYLSAALLVAAGFVTTAHASTANVPTVTAVAPSATVATPASVGEPATARCGDYRCEPPEDCHSCPGDCGSCCGNYRCEPPEDCRSCPQDCGNCH